LKASRHTNQGELSDLVKSRTELECAVADLQSAAERAGGSVTDLGAELESVEDKITEKEAELQGTDPAWEDVRTRASELKRALDEKRGQLNVLYSKQGRLERFRTKAERDGFLTSEIASIERFHETQSAALEAAQADLERAKTSLQEVEDRREAVRASTEQSRQKIVQLTQDMAAEKDRREKMSETRKALWREDTKLDSLLSRTNEELRNAERALASVMDKARRSHLRYLVG
jgi:structural maintenance of chromosome 3 (chondroitin sulfate proteoglycan 6)